MNVFTYFRDEILSHTQKLIAVGTLPEGLDLARITVEPPKDPAHGDLATNVAMVLAKSAHKNPRDLAKIYADSIQSHPDIDAVEIAGPGFINLRVKMAFWQKQIPYILEAGINYGEANIGVGQPANIEYVSVNPTGPMHAGHGRNAVFGDAIASLLEKVGYKVTREYYMNDAGGQTIALARSVYLRYLEALGRSITLDQFTEDMYFGDYLIPVGQELAKKFGDQWLDKPESEWMESIRHYAINAMMELIRGDLAALGVVMDVYTSEEKIVKELGMDTVLTTLTASGDIYTGVLEKPKGHDADDWEPRPQTLFRSTAYGDDVDRALQKSDGSWTYFASDILYHHNKLQRGFKTLIDILGADHAGYVKRLTAVVKALSRQQAHFEIKTCQLVNFMDKGQAVKMSKRAGTFIKLRDVIEQVGKDVVRFIMLTRRQDVGIDFDFEKVVEQTKDNPVFYVQYAHARACSVLRHGLTQFPELKDLSQIDINLLTDPAELEMIKVLAGWPRQVEVAALSLEPHRIAYYLYEVAAGFHLLWNKGKENTELRFIDSESQANTGARLALVKALATVIASGLALFKVTPVEEMR